MQAQRNFYFSEVYVCLYRAIDASLWKAEWCTHLEETGAARRSNTRPKYLGAELNIGKFDLRSP